MRRFCGAIVVAVLLLSGCNREPFSYVKVSGKITYDDGSVIPAPRIMLKFISTAPGPDQHTNPPQGIAEVDVKTGEFAYASSHLPKDGIVPGEHKVLVLGGSPEDVVPLEYTKIDKTPLTVNTSELPFTLKIHKPK